MWRSRYGGSVPDPDEIAALRSQWQVECISVAGLPRFARGDSSSEKACVWARQGRRFSPL